MIANHAELDGLRERVGVLESDHVRLLRVSGDDAFEALDAILPVPLYLQEAEMRATLLLDERGRPWADVLVGREDDDFLLHLEALEPTAAANRLRELLSAASQATVTDLSEELACLSIHGPWAWELAADFLGPEVMGQPYLTLDRLGEALCIRAGKTGEYGYDIFVPRAQLAAWRERLTKASHPYDAVSLSLATLDHAALENFFFCVRATTLLDLSPTELQLQWRVSREKDYPGAAILASAREGDRRRRLTTLLAPEPLAEQSHVWLEERCIGQVLRAAWSPHLDRCVAWAILELRYAVAGVNHYSVGTAGGPRTPVVTVSPPVVDNLSLHVDRHQHSYRHGRRPR